MAANPTQRMLQRLCTKLPKEVLDTILSYPELGRADLHAVLFVNSVFHDLALRHLYRSIVANLSIEPAHGPTLSPARCIALLHTLCRSPALGALVRELQLDWSQHQPTGTLFRLLNRALRALPNLSVLALEVSSAAGRFSLAWVFDGCRGALTSFTTSARCDGALARFLATQPLLEEVCLRGFRAHDPFALPPGALPRLRAFRAIHAGPAVFAEVVRGRPVEAITLSLFTEDGLATLAVLAQSARPLRKLTIMSLDCTDPALMLAEVARTSPELESLHIVILFGRYETVRAACYPFFSLHWRSPWPAPRT